MTMATAKGTMGSGTTGCDHDDDKYNDCDGNNEDDNNGNCDGAMGSGVTGYDD